MTTDWENLAIAKKIINRIDNEEIQLKDWIADILREEIQNNSNQLIEKLDTSARERNDKFAEIVNLLQSNIAKKISKLHENTEYSIINLQDQISKLEKRIEELEKKEIIFPEIPEYDEEFDKIKNELSTIENTVKEVREESKRIDEHRQSMKEELESLFEDEL